VMFPGVRGAQSVAISPDGRRVALASQSGRAIRSRIYLRELNQLTVREVPGTDFGTSPFFSPDGRWIAFFVGGRLMKVSVDGGAPTIVADAPGSQLTLSGSWGPDDTILFTKGNGIWRVGANGGTATDLTRDHTEWLSSPRHLPEDSSFLFVRGAIAPLGSARQGGNLEIVAQGVDQSLHGILKGPNEAQWSNSGHLVYAESGSLFAALFDAKRLSLSGPPAPLADGVALAPSGNFSLSSVNSLVYLPTAANEARRELVWVDRSGRVQPTGAPAQAYVLPRISPSGTRVAVTTDDGVDRAAWTYDWERNTLSRLTLDTPGQNPVWSPDGTRIAFESLKPGAAPFVIKTVDGSGAEVSVDAPGDGASLQSWSPDGRTLVYQVTGPSSDRDLWTISIDGKRTAAPLIQTRFFEGGGTVSPDGRYVAWVSVETGTNQVYVQAYPGGGGKVQVSTVGGIEPVWAKSGKELFYRLDDKLMAVKVGGGAVPVVGRPAVVFSGPFDLYGGARPNYDVSADGQRFLMLRTTDSGAQGATVMYVSEWTQLLKDKRR
jgi:Tol biopolymer transport system component